MEREGDGHTNSNWFVCSGHQKSLKKDWRKWKFKKNPVNTDRSAVKIGQNTHKSPGDLRRVTGTQTGVKNS